MFRWFLSFLVLLLLPNVSECADENKGIFLALDEDDQAGLEFGLSFADRLFEASPEQGFEILAGGRAIRFVLEGSPVKQELERVTSKHPRIRVGACTQTLEKMRSHSGADAIVLLPPVVEVDCDVRYRELADQQWRRLSPPGEE